MIRSNTLVSVHRENIESLQFKQLLTSCSLKHLSLVGFANDKRDSNRVQVISPVENIENLHLLSKIKNLETLELVEIASTDTR